MAQRSSRGGNDARAVIGASTRIRGRITGDGHLTVDGSVEGDIAIRGDLVVGEGASLTSNVEAESVSIAGSLDGDVSARGLVKLGAGAKMSGNIKGEQIAIDEGAEFAGRLDCDFELPAELSGSSRKRA
jgi:cytoskeletal protein CcmA (bactofilin family)